MSMTHALASQHWMHNAIEQSPVRRNSKLGTLNYPSAGILKNILNGSAADKSNPQLNEYHDSMRENWGKALDLTRVLPRPRQSAVQFVPGMAILGECHCQIMDRVGEQNSRFVAEDTIVQAAKEIQTSGQIPHMVAMGAGILGQEVYLLRQLSKAGIQNAKLDLIELDFENADPESSPESIQLIQQPKYRDFFANEMVSGFSFAFNGKFRLVETETSECSKLYRNIKQYLPEVDNQPDHHLEVRIFKDSAAYLKEYSAVKKVMKKNTPRPNVIYDIDFLPAEKARSKEINRVTDTMGVGAHHISLNKVPGAVKVQLLHKVKEVKGWSVRLDRSFS